MIIYEWAKAWAISPLAVNDLLSRLGVGYQHTVEPLVNYCESGVQSRVRLEAKLYDTVLWRNNVGAMSDESGRTVRYGLCNDSAQLNKSIKSGDLIGIRKRLITQMMVGQVIGQFVSREVKRSNWNYLGTSEELAQLKWVNLVNSLGGDAKFTNGEGSFK